MELIKSENWIIKVSIVEDFKIFTLLDLITGDTFSVNDSEIKHVAHMLLSASCLADEITDEYIKYSKQLL